MAETSTSPGYYGTEIYSYINELDPTFKDDVSPQEFLERLQDEEYAGKIYAYLADSDETFIEDLSLDEFFSNVKKKEVTDVTESVSDVGSSVLLPSTEVPEGGLLPEVNQFGNQVDELGVELPKSDSPFELMDYRKRRAEVTSERDTPARRLADQVQAEEMERLEEERKIAAASMPAVPALEGREAPDYVAQLREVYGPYGVRFETSTALGLGEFGSIKAYAVGADGNAVEYDIDIVDGKVVEAQLNGLNEFLQSNARAKGGVEVDKRSLSEKALRVQEMRPVARLNEDGSQSTVLMASAEADGRHFAYPTLFPTGDGFSADPSDWTEMDADSAFAEAQRRGELFEFDTAEEANRFAEGEWKEIRETDAIAEQMWAEKGRNYYADEMFLRKIEEKKREYEFLESLAPGGDKSVSRLGTRHLDEMEIPTAYQQYLVTYTDERGVKTLIARTDIEEVRQQKERELAALEQQFDNDNELLRLKEDYDELLGKRRGEVMERAAALNQEGKTVQNRADVASINRFGVPVKGLMSMQPQTEGEYNEMLGLLTQYNTGIDQRRTAALQYEKNKLYYDAQHEKLINQEYVDGWEEVWMKAKNGWKRGNAMSKLLLMHYGYYDAIGDDKAEEDAMREVSAIMDSMDTRVGRATSRTNMTGTTESFLERINPLDAGMDAATYTAALTAESLGQLAPLWYRVALPTAIAGGVVGGTYGAAAGPGGAVAGFAGGALSGFLKAGFYIGMPVSELALEMGNAILEVGEKKGYDWADPNSALLALNDESVWKEGADRGYKRGIPIALTGMVSNMVMAKAALGGSRVLPFAERMAIGVGTGVTVEPATEMLGEYLAIQATGEYTGSTANVKEIAAEGLGAIGMGVGFTTSLAALGYAKDVVTDANFDLALRLMDPAGIAQENVRGERIVSWANRMETLGKIDAEQAEAIRKNVGRRRQANELLGKKIDSRPGSDSQVIGRIVELLEAKEELERSGPNVFGEKIRAITEEIALIAESGKVEKPGGAAVNLSDIRGRIRNRRPGVYKFNGKKVTREDFMAKLQEATPRQLKRARAYNDIEAQRELIIRRDAIQKRKAAEVPVGEQPGVSPQVDQQVREATQEDLQAEEQGSLDLDRKAVILESIAEKLNDKVELNEVEQAFLEDNKEDIEAEQKRLETLDQAAAEVEVLGEPEVEGRIPLKRLKRLASNAKKALAKNFPDANIIIHNDKASYQQAAQENGLTGERSAGFIGTDDKTIHIFAPLASETTVAHETFHAILRNTIDSAQTQELMGEFVTTLKKVIPPDNPLAAKLDKYQQLYDAGQMNEEYVAEFFGELAAAYPTLDKKGKSVIARFLARLGKLLGVDLTLSPDLTARDKQIVSLLERLAGQVSRGETVTARETEALRSLTTDRKQTEDNLGAAEQRVDDFSDEQIQAMANQGVAFHFSDVDITKVLPEKLKRTIYGYGFYTTSEGRSNSVFRTYGDRVTLIDTNQLNLLDGDTRITEEQAKKLRDFAKMELEELDETGELVYFPEKAIVLQSLAELKAGAAWANVLIEGSAEAVFGDVQMVPREIANRSTRPDVITYDIPQQAQVAALIQEAFGFDGADFGRGVNMDETRYGIISAIWNFDKLNRAIIEPGQEPTRAAEQRAQRMDDGPPKFNEDGLPEVRAAEQRALWEDATPEKIQEYFEDEQYSLERSVVLGLANTPDVRLWFMRGGFLYGYDTPDGPVAVARIGIGNVGGKAYLDLLEVLVDDEGQGRSRGAGTRFMQEFTAVLDELDMGAELLAYPPRWYQDTMRGNEMDAIAERLVDFYSKFGFVRKGEGGTSMTREPGAQPVVFDKESREDARFRNRTLALIEKKKADLELAEKLIYNSFEALEDVLSPSQKSELEETLDRDPFDLQFGELTEEQVDRVQAEFSEVPVSDELLVENFDDLLEFAEIVKEEMDELESMQMLDPSPTKTVQEAASQRERKLGELEDKGLALEHILAVNEAEYGRTETDVYNDEYEQYLEGRLDEADKEYLRSLRLGIDVNTGRVDNANDLYDVFSELQDVREQRNDLETGLTRAAEQRVATNEDGSPKTFYHGTDATFEEFVPTEGTRTVLGVDIPVTAPAFFFTEDEAVAREYGKNVIPANLSFAKMVQDNVAEAGRIMKEVFPDGIEFSNGVINYDEYSRDENWIAKVLDDELGLDWMLLDEPDFVDALKAAGFDGTLVYESDDETSVAAFDNSSIQRLDREPRAAEQRIDIDAVRTRSRAGSRVSKGLATYNVDGVAQVEEIENLTRDYVREQAPEAYIKNAKIIAKYPLVRGVREFGDITTVEEADELYDIYTQQTMDNLRWMMETYPDEFSEISTLWYDGANKIANELATEFDVTPEQAAGILAALSPQKDWYQNAHLARLLLEAFADNPVMTREMVNYQRKFTKNKIAGKKKALKKARAAKGKSRAKAKVDKFNKDKARLLNDIAVAEALLESIAALEGTRMLDADPSMMGYYVRLHSETTKQPSYPVISPDGEMAGPALKDNGQPAKWAWGSYNEIGKGVSINLNGSPENVTISLGQQHKVRNFFNNIIDPMSAEGDVTMDTHAIAVSLLKPLSTASAEVEHNFGSKEVSNSGAKGIKGTYYANQEAYQMLAEEMGLLPRQVQSVTWEAVRGLFTDKFKSNKENVNAINQIWENYADGKITIDEARAQVLERAGGINPPVWAESVQGELGAGVRESRERGAGREGGRAAEQRISPDTEGPTIVYRSGAVDSKAENRYRMSGGRSTGHFGTGAYFFSDRKRAEEYDDREVTAVDTRDYNLAPATYSLHDALAWANRRPSSLELRNQQRNENKPHTITMEEVRLVEAANRIERLRGGMPISYRNKDRWSELYNIMFDEYYKQMMPRPEAERIAAEATRLYNEEGNIDSASTSIMKALGYEGVNAVGTPLDNSTYGTVIYDVKTEPRAAEQRVVVYRDGDLVNKGEPRAEAESGRSTGHFGTGFYFFGDRDTAERSAESRNRPVSELDITNYNLAPASYFLHAALQEVNKRASRAKGRHVITPKEIQYAQIAVEQGPSFRDYYNIDDALRIYKDQLLDEGTARRIAAEATRRYNEETSATPDRFGRGMFLDSASTAVMKALGYEGVNAVGTELDNYTYGTVIYDVKPGAAEQRVVGPELAKVLQRYEFKSNDSLKNAELAPELRRNLKRFGYGVKQYGTRMNDFRVVSLDTGRAVDPNKLIEEGLAEGRAMAEEQRTIEAEQRARELEERIIEIYNADERPYTGRDFEDRAAEQKVVVEAMAEPGTIADLVARGRELGLRDASIRSVLLKRFGKDNADAIDTALTEYFDMFRAIPEAFGNVEGGIEVGRQIYDDVRRQLDEFARPKKPGRMTTRERTDRIAELRAKFPEQKKLSDTELLRKHPRQAVAPAIADVRAEALNLLRNNRLFNEQTTEVQEQLLVAFDKTLQTKANKQVNTLISQIRNNIRQRRKGVSNANRVRNELKKMLTELLPAGKYTKAEAKAITTLVNNVTEDNMLVQIEKLMDLVDKKAKADINAELQDIMKLDRRIRSERKYAEREARKVQKNLRRLINEVLPRADYTKTDVNRLNKLVNEVNENNYDDKAEQVLKIVDKKREAIRQSLLKDIENIVKKAAKTRRTPTGKVRPRSLDAPGQAFFRTALRVLRAVRADDATQIENIKASLSHNPEVDEVTQKYLNGESLTSREQQLMDQKSALDIFYELNGKSIEELEAIIEDLKITAAFSRANLKATRAARAERMAALREGAKESVTRDWGGLAVNEDGTAKSQNQIEADLRKQKSLGEALKTRGMRAKYDALMEWAQEGKRMAPAKIASNAWSHYGSLTGIMGEFFRENLYKRLGKMEEDYLRGRFKERENLDAMANSVEGVNNGFVEIGEIIFTNGDLTVKYGNNSRKFTTDELLRIYALSKNPVQKQRLMLMGFTDEVMADITEFLDDRLIEFADKTVAYLSTDYYEGVNDVHVKVNDVNLPYVENYFPTKTQLEEFFRLDDEQAMRSTFFGPNAQLASPLKDRVAQTSEISLKRDLGFHGELTSHINSMERFKAFAEGTQEMNAVLSDSYTTALANLIGAEKAIVMLAAQGVSPERFMSEMRAPLVDKLVSSYTGVSLGYKLMQVVKQASSMFAGIQDYQYGDKKNPIIDRIMWSMDMMRILPGAILEGVSLAKYKGPIQQMMEESATLRSRMEDTLEGDLYGLATGASGTATKLSKKDFQKAQKALKGVRKGGAAVTAFGDALGVLGYVPAYQRNRQRGMSKREAIDKFNEYNETQQSRRPGERAPIQIYRDGYRRLLTAFSSSQLLYLNNMLRLTAQINRSVRQGGWRSVSASDLRGLYFNAFGAAFTFAIASNIMLILFGSDEEKEKAWYDVLFSWTKNFFIYPILGTTAESVYNKLMGNKYPKRIALDPLDRVERSMTKAVKDGEFGPAIQNTTEMLIGTNLDPAISLIEVAGGEPLEDEIYEIIGVPKSARPE